MSELSVGASSAWQIAAREAAAARHQHVERDHLFIGICSLEKLRGLPGGGEAAARAQADLAAEAEAVADVFGEFGLEPTRLRRGVRERLGRGSYEHTERVVHRSAACKEVFERACELARPARELGCLHLLAAVLEDPGDVIGGVLGEAGVKSANIRQSALAHVGGGGEPRREMREAHHDAPKPAQTDTNYLDRYGRDLTREAREGRLGPFVGRRAEILQVIQTLARRSKNNPVLVGEAGVGKTAIVEALALRIAQGKDSDVLAGKRIVELNMGALLGGTKYRGEFEERLTRIVEEARTHPEVIVFIDEIHNVVGAGRGEGSMDAANLMKPALARGELRCVGATTIGEYRRYIEADPALERRFERVTVDEPTPEEALEILKGLRPKLEEHHRVQIDDRALEVAVSLSIRFDGDHQLPDKAIDLVDKAGARTRVPALSMMGKGAGEGAAEPTGEVTDGSGAVAEGDRVTELAVARVLSEKVRVPLEIVAGHLAGVTQSRLLELRPFLKRKLVGQDDAVDRLGRRLVMAHAQLVKRRGPLAVFLLLGPTGVGKTELARSLAAFLFGGESNLIRLDMSEYMEEHSVAKLIGSPPGYVGHEEEGQLTGKLRTRPYSVVLLDEVEKAHPRVFDLFLQVFDEGRLTDSKGRTADARNAIFVMTSNLAADKQMGFRPDDVDAARHAVLREVQTRFRAEFINRIDDQIVFRPLSEADVQEILRPMLDEIRANLLKERGAVLRVTAEAERALAKAGYSPSLGARELRRTVERLVQFPLSELVVGGKMVAGSHWQAISHADGISIVPAQVGGETV